MTDVWQITVSDEAGTRLLAEFVATKAAAGDIITLQGDLGAGKTTFARYLIRALLADDGAEVPSPTFTLLQTYESARFPVRHFDLYRISGPDELDELEFDDPAGDAVTIVEWPDRAGEVLGTSRLDIMLSEVDDGDEGARRIAIAATPEAAGRLSRIRAAHAFCAETFAADVLTGLRIAYLKGDASTRSYARLGGGPCGQLLMDMPKQPDGPVIRDGKSYSEIAHLAEDARPFVAIASALRGAGLTVPRIDRFDAGRGLALIEDFGDRSYAAALAEGISQETLWHAAVDVLVHLRRHPPPSVVGAAGGIRHTMPLYDRDVMQAEISLLCDWYWPHVTGAPIDAGSSAAFDAVWAPFLADVATGPGNAAANAWVLRDYHSPNLLWLPDRDGIARVGVIDFQDAQIGHAAYDLVSLTLDARLDVPRVLHEALLDVYCKAVAPEDPGFDEAEFRRAAALLGAQRNTKLLGIFARLSMRDGKHEYIRHIPRIRRYLAWSLAHPDLAGLKAWYDAALPAGDD